jgi:hypothetical protein
VFTVALKERTVKWTSWLALGVLVALVTFVVYSSLTVGGTRCEVCIAFRGRQACRAVDGANEEEALMAARTNTCAQLAAGVTDSMACERTPFTSQTCRPQ